MTAPNFAQMPKTDLIKGIGGNMPEVESKNRYPDDDSVFVNQEGTP
jgi:hypothetical protein